jgi:hypothetical protein
VNKRNATVLGFVTASSVAPFHLALSALSFEPKIENLVDAGIYLAATFLIFLPYSVLAGSIVGVPIYLISKRFGVVTWWMAALAGFTAGACAALAMFARTSMPIQLLTYALLGTIAGLLFWLVRSFAEIER